MNFPDCGGPMWDNRDNKRNPRSPDFKCKDRDCGKGVWAKKSQGGGGAQGRGAAPRNTKPLTPLYVACLQDAKGAVTHILGKDATPELILNAAATLFIAASRDGTPLRASKPKPPPPPVEEESQDAEYDDIDAEADKLPF